MPAVVVGISLGFAAETKKKRAGIGTGGQHKNQVWVALRLSSSAWIDFVMNDSSILDAFNLRMAFSYISLDFGLVPTLP